MDKLFHLLEVSLNQIYKSLLFWRSGEMRKLRRERFLLTCLKQTVWDVLLFITDIIGKWNLILSVMEKGKRKDHRIVVDRVFSPQPTQYPLGEMQISLSGRDKPGAEQELQTDTVIGDDIDYNRFMDAYEDSLSKRGMREKITVWVK